MRTKMDTLKINKGKTLMVAHRGVSGLEQENTALAFVAALPTALIRHYLLFKKKRDLPPSAHEKN